MFAEQLRRAVEASPRAELHTVSALLWKAYAAGHVTEAEASVLSEAIELKKALPAAQKPAQRRFGSRPRSPAAMERRRPWRAGSRWPSKPSWLWSLLNIGSGMTVASPTRRLRM